jgi:hypothetical protein
MRRAETSLVNRPYCYLLSVVLAAGCGSSTTTPKTDGQAPDAAPVADARPADARVDQATAASDAAGDSGVPIGASEDAASADTAAADDAAPDAGAGDDAESSDATLEPDAGVGGAPDRTPVAGPLVGYWPLDEAAGTTTADLSGNGGAGTLEGGVAWVTPGFPAATFANPAALMLDGIDDDVALPAAALPRIEAPKTISVWFYLQAPAGAGRQNIVALTNFPMNAGVQVGLENGKPTAWFMDDASPIVIADSVAAAGWHHLAYTYDGTTHLLYVDNVPVPAGTKPSPVAAPTETAWLGTFDLKIELFAGRVDDVRIYNQPLDAAAVGALFMGRTP